jgi:hypothetical protein
VHGVEATIADLKCFDDALRVEPDLLASCTSMNLARKSFSATLTLLADDARTATDAAVAIFQLALKLAGIPAGGFPHIELEPEGPLRATA